MLVSKKKSDEIVSIRLVSGDEIIGRLMPSTENGTTLSDPISTVMQQSRNGEIGLSFAPFMASINDGAVITFPDSACLCRPTPTREDVANAYIEATTPASSIIQHPKGLIFP